MRELAIGHKHDIPNTIRYGQQAGFCKSRDSLWWTSDTGQACDESIQCTVRRPIVVASADEV